MATHYWVDEETPSASQASLGKAGCGASVLPLQLLGPPSGPLGERWLLLALCPERVSFLGRPCALLSLSNVLGVGTLWELGWLVHQPWSRKSKVLWGRRMKNTWEEISAPLESSEDFFASLENEHLWASVSSCFIPQPTIRKIFGLTVSLLLKVQVKLMLVETNRHGWVKTNKTQQHRSRIWNQDTRGKLKLADIKKAGVATAQD